MTKSFIKKYIDIVETITLLHLIGISLQLTQHKKTLIENSIIKKKGLPSIKEELSDGEEKENIEPVNNNKKLTT